MKKITINQTHCACILTHYLYRLMRFKLEQSRQIWHILTWSVVREKLNKNTFIKAPEKWYIFFWFLTYFFSALPKNSATACQVCFILKIWYVNLFYIVFYAEGHRNHCSSESFISFRLSAMSRTNPSKKIYLERHTHHPPAEVDWIAAKKSLFFSMAAGI